jgi:superfamily II RNA helicase
MVVICDKPYDAETLIEYDGKQLSDFQKWALKAITEGDNVLITAHTGSGKTLPTEYAIQHFTAQHKKVIYASPIKALSNQKLYDLRRKFPSISFGILTGDCKDNPEADVLIMTTEILRNTLLNKIINGQAQASAASASSTAQASAASASSTAQASAASASSTASASSMAAAQASTGPTQLPLLFEMNFETELAAVVFDEVHYINDAERGSVWEQAILLLPPQVQLIMLSATIDRPEDFAGWIETEKRQQAEKALVKVKQMYLAPTYTRVVPLTHYMWLSVHEGSIKKAAKTPYEKKLEDMRKTPIVIATSDGSFREDNYYKVKDIKDYLFKHNVYTKRQFVLEDLLKHLKREEMLPAICFVFSRKHVEQAAHEISFSLYEDDSILPTQVEKECRHILQAKLPNYQEYLNLPEYLNIVKLLEKGVAIHHAGIIPVLREMVELLFEKGFIRLLIATETFAVGLNMPTKTVIFAGLTKFNGSGMRLLFPHEYTQMAGRAGRRGLDTIGHVFHCVNLFEMPTATDYRHMLTGPPQSLVSKFKLSFTMALSMLAAGKDMEAFMSQSLLSTDLRRELQGYAVAEAKSMEIVQTKQAQIKLCRTPQTALENYKYIVDRLPGLANSARKKARIDLNTLEAEHNFILKDLVKLEEVYAALSHQSKVGKEKENTAQYIVNTLDALQKILLEYGFSYFTGFSAGNDLSGHIEVSPSGRIAAQLQEVHPLAMADLYRQTVQFAELDATYLAGLFSCFYPVSVSDEFRAHYPNAPGKLRETILLMSKLLDKYYKAEQDAYLITGSNYDICYDLLPYVLLWCESKDEGTCKEIIQQVKTETGLFIGEFVKALLKVNAVAMEFERVCEATGNMLLLEKIRKIPQMTLKYIATSQSLYL